MNPFMFRLQRITPGQPSSRGQLWQTAKTKAGRDSKPAQSEQAIHQLCNQLFPGKESTIR